MGLLFQVCLLMTVGGCHAFKRLERRIEQNLRDQSITRFPGTKAYHSRIILLYETPPQEESAASSERLLPGDADIATMFERWTLSLTTGIDWELISVRGACEPKGGHPGRVVDAA